MLTMEVLIIPGERVEFTIFDNLSKKIEDENKEGKRSNLGGWGGLETFNANETEN